MAMTKKDKAVIIVSELYQLDTLKVRIKHKAKENPIHRHVNKLIRMKMEALDDNYEKALAVRRQREETAAENQEKGRGALLNMNQKTAVMKVALKDAGRAFEKEWGIHFEGLSADDATLHMIGDYRHNETSPLDVAGYNGSLEAEDEADQVWEETFRNEYARLIENSAHRIMDKIQDPVRIMKHHVTEFMGSERGLEKALKVLEQNADSDPEAISAVRFRLAGVKTRIDSLQFFLSSLEAAHDMTRTAGKINQIRKGNKEILKRRIANARGAAVKSSHDSGGDVQTLNFMTEWFGDIMELIDLC